jgi:hypothetical protein
VINKIASLFRAPNLPRCPFCSVELDSAKMQDQMWCVYQEKRGEGNAGRYKQAYSMKEIESDGDWQTVDDAFFPPHYSEDALEQRVRMVSLIGDSTTGKTVWLRSVGSQTLLPELAHTHLDAWLRARNTFTERMLQQYCVELALGGLPPSTPHVGKTDTYTIRLGEKNPRHFVLRDIGGEVLQQQTVPAILNDRHKAHLLSSDCHLYVLNGRSKPFLKASRDYVARWLQDMHPRLMKERPRHAPHPRAIVAVSQCDWSTAPKKLADALRQGPNCFRYGEQFELGDYLQRMVDVESETRAFLRETGGRLVEMFEREYASVHYTAFSAFGTPPASCRQSQDGAEVRQFKCVTEPACVRVMDPLLWLLREEKLI